MADSSKAIIGRDESEMSRLRRFVNEWRDNKETGRSWIAKVLRAAGHERSRVIDPEWEIGVYPLYYFLLKQEKTPTKVYDRAIREARKSDADLDFEKHMRQATNAEIDLLIEDADFFVFVEAKAPSPGTRATFRPLNGIHQLVRQFAQGHVLAALVKKQFVLATLGAKDGKPLRLHDILDDHQWLFLRSLGIQETGVLIPDLPWEEW